MGWRAPLNPRCSARQMEAIGKLSDDMRRHFRMKLRNLFTKFIRKFGSVHRTEGELRGFQSPHGVCREGAGLGGARPPVAGRALAEPSYLRRALSGPRAPPAPRRPAGLSW